ncbi:conserved Plasmodium protein, unknown function [Plasmodium berghei]|uniref:Uncharacterized protein n=2 Tax=Plasmodium berghei TaxID=5821 RepID=A0A509AHL2_PLABA|nr:conserved Plasmodium protein, unknown function [Plasmodium berghei ANKA]CXI19650.1 conserved Plasmodium protein, unknown function [Plasmodium berghei]SCM19868.1 conserved Plasmodium protein, unknown function [Plasmodium berghei]SCN23601.1 conserved Plasmodium protein, unknown function [Plasmodium berghei]SCO59167.1 conserved Plasmodium protein, unknown function [Plasmodium berghei]SCO59958.1 conserved Plasmodium protein, unknown function [Plasmodium berghei]|eukprot:XP_034420680.1 conserved Plasmodium protein, unknown function [Plasmodium berghei ANKA]
MSYASCHYNYVNINQNQKEDLHRFETSIIDNYKYYKRVENKSRIRIILTILIISFILYGIYKSRDNKIVIETMSNIPLMISVTVFLFYRIKSYYKNLFKSGNYIKNLNKTLKDFNLYLDRKNLKLCIIGNLRKEH